MIQLRWDNIDRPRIIKYFNRFGMLLTRICGEEKDDSSFKNPAEEWSIGEQTDEFLESKDWSNSTGFGIQLGHNSYRAIDIDDIADAPKLSHHYYGSDIARFARRELINNCLRLLGLPSTYEWVVRSPKGYHIIFRAKPISGMPNSIAYKPNAFYSKDNAEQVCFSRIELLWRTHLVMAPSKGLKKYSYYEYAHCYLPKEPPSFVDVRQIENLLDYYCGFTGFANKIDVGYDTNRISGALFFRAQIKKRTYRGSMEEMDDYYESQQLPYTNSCRVLQFGGLDSNTNWLKACATPEAYNKLGIISYIVDDSVDSAIKYFNQSNSDNSNYNHACLISLNKQEGDLKRMLSYLNKTSVDEHLKELLRAYYYYSHKHIPNIIFVSLCTTAKKDDMDSIESDESLPRLLEFSWLSTDSELNLLRLNGCYIKPEGFLIPIHVSKAGGLTHEFARRYGDDCWDLSIVSLINAIASADIVVGFDAEFIMTILHKTMESVDVSKWYPAPDYPEDWADKDIVCLKRSSVSLMKDAYGCEKSPSLADLFEYLMGEEYLRSKDSKYNVECLLRIYSLLNKKGFKFETYNFDPLPF